MKACWTTDTVLKSREQHGREPGLPGDLPFGNDTVFPGLGSRPTGHRRAGQQGNGQACGRTVELVDLYRTLADLCGLSTDSKTEGASLKPLLQNPQAVWSRPAYSQVTRGAVVGTDTAKKAKDCQPIMGRSVRTERWRYTEWDEGRQGTELYDHNADPREMKNLASDSKHAETVAKLKHLLTNQRP